MSHHSVLQQLRHEKQANERLRREIAEQKVFNLVNTIALSRPNYYPTYPEDIITAVRSFTRIRPRNVTPSEFYETAYHLNRKVTDAYKKQMIPRDAKREVQRMILEHVRNVRSY